MVFGVYGGACNMYPNFADPLASDQTAPIGEKATRATEIRWEDPETDQLIDELQGRNRQGRAEGGRRRIWPRS